MTMANRIALVGLYNSGSSAMAGMLHRLGANLGPPFFATDKDTAGNHYEPYDLSFQLRRWWQEPLAVETVDPDFRREFLARWISLQEVSGASAVGAKHPLLSLCVSDLRNAWGEDTRILWCFRPLEQSIDGLMRRGWFPGHADKLQRTLWAALESADAERRLQRLEWLAVKSQPRAAAYWLANWAGLQPAECQIEAATAFVAAVSAEETTKRHRLFFRDWRGLVGRWHS